MRIPILGYSDCSCLNLASILIVWTQNKYFYISTVPSTWKLENIPNDVHINFSEHCFNQVVPKMTKKKFSFPFKYNIAQHWLSFFSFLIHSPTPSRYTDHCIDLNYYSVWRKRINHDSCNYRFVSSTKLANTIFNMKILTVL